MPKFAIGQIIHHRRYDYRGVIAEIDAFCEAPEDWYQRNPTQPEREQPWYHVLVDGGEQTYVAETNLELDATGDEIRHPLVPRLFRMFLNGRYYVASPN